MNVGNAYLPTSVRSPLARERLPEGVLDHGSEGPTRLGGQGLGPPEQLVVKPNSRPHTSKHITVTFICQPVIRL